MSGQGRVAGRKRPTQQKALGLSKKSTHRSIIQKFEITSHGHRGHNIEYSDPMGFPCGATIYIPDHFRTCQECDAIRTIFDTWAAEKARIAHAEGTPYEPPPALTHAAVKEILRRMGATLQDVSKQKDSWNPTKPIQMQNELAGGLVATTESFVETYDNMSPKVKIQCLRPTLPSLMGIDNRSEMFGTVPCQHRKLNTQNELMEYVVRSGICDGKLDSHYLDKVVANFGGVDKRNFTHKELSDACGINSDQLRDMIPKQVVGGEVNLQDYLHSPRFLSGDLNIPFKRHTRIPPAVPMGDEEELQQQIQQLKQQIQKQKQRIQELERNHVRKQRVSAVSPGATSGSVPQAS